MSMLSLLLAAAAAALLAKLLADAVRTLFFDALARFPGPPLCRWTSLGELWEQRKDRAAPPMRRLHARYGPIVRVGPAKLFFADPAAALELYSPSRNLPKSDQYTTFAPTAFGKPVVNFFASQDIAYHDRIRKIASPPFTRVLQHETHVDASVADLLRIVRARFADVSGPAGAVDMTKWANYFALDAVSRIVYGREYGFMKSDTDVHGILAMGAALGWYWRWIGPAPWLDKLFLKNPLFLWLQKVGVVSSENSVVNLAFRLQQERVQIVKNDPDRKEEEGVMLDDLIRAGIAQPDVLDDVELMKVGIAVVLAGGDTTGSLLSAMFYYLATHPEALQKLTEEVDATPSELSYNDARKLKYLDACLLEAKRLTPVVRFTPERVVRKGGIILCGEFIPEGTIVGANPYPISRRQDVYGDDPDKFRPERWLQADVEQRRTMERILPIFGFGKYLCPGRSIVIVENMKLWPALLREFTFELAEPARDLAFSDTQISRPQNVALRFKKRNIAL